jgi:hypothetical protein
MQPTKRVVTDEDPDANAAATKKPTKLAGVDAIPVAGKEQGKRDLIVFSKNAHDMEDG